MEAVGQTPTRIVTTLYRLACEQSKLPRIGRSAEASIQGHRFEDLAAKAAYEALVQVGVMPRLPRHTLQLPTLSGLSHQLDLVVSEGLTLFAIELKHRSLSNIDQLQAFIAKLLDYALAARNLGTGHRFSGVFVSTASSLNDHFRQYALAYGVLPIAKDLPPCVVLHECPGDPTVRRDALDLSARLAVPLPEATIMRQRNDPSVLLQEWKALALRWSQRCLGGDAE